MRPRTGPRNHFCRLQGRNIKNLSVLFRNPAYNTCVAATCLPLQQLLSDLVRGTYKPPATPSGRSHRPSVVKLPSSVASPIPGLFFPVRTGHPSGVCRNVQPPGGRLTPTPERAKKRAPLKF